MAIVVQREREKALLADTSGKEKVDSDISECSADKTKLNNIHSESIPSPETSLVVAKHGKHKKLARLDFLGAKGVVYLFNDYRVVHDPQDIAELCSVNKEHKVTKDQIPEDKEEVLECQQLGAYDGETPLRSGTYTSPA